jgi:hypothetical protein
MVCLLGCLRRKRLPSGGGSCFSEVTHLRTGTRELSASFNFRAFEGNTKMTWVDGTAGYFNVGIGKLKHFVGRLRGSAELAARAKGQVERGWAQLAWGRENASRNKSVATAKDRMMRKLNGR